MKVTINIDDEILARVMASSGIKSKTEAINHTLREWDRRHRLREMLEKIAARTGDEMRDSFDPDYDLMASRLAETAALYGKRTRPD
jgi:Arc/MetJ family transcription regulator